jgi:phage shock protein A
VFGWLKRKKRKDPLRAFDALLEELIRQGSTLRKGAATLLALKSALSHQLQECSARARDCEVRAAQARREGDQHGATVLTADARASLAKAETHRAALERTTADAELLLEAARRVTAKVSELEAERASAALTLAASEAVTAALREQVERFEQVLALEEARDELARAHALAELYREDARK